MKIAFDLRLGLQHDRLGTNRAGDFAVHQHLLTRNQPRDLALLSDDDLGGLNITLDFAVNLKDASAYDPQTLADDAKVVANNRFVPGFGRPGSVLDAVGDTNSSRRRTTRTHAKTPKFRKVLS